MALAKTARVASIVEVTPDVRLLELEPAQPLDFVGGQYLIVNSGVVLPGGKLAKRAYSILSPDGAQARVQLAVQRLPGGPASSFLHEREVGDTIEFSGPWGKYLPDDSRPRATSVIATDTGITAALGLVRGARFAPQRALTRLLWLVDPDRPFLPESFVREAAGVAVDVQGIPPVGDPARVALAVDLVRRAAAPADSLFLSGDGAVLYPLRDALCAIEGARLECFFNNPEKKST